MTVAYTATTNTGRSPHRRPVACTRTPSRSRSSRQGSTASTASAASITSTATTTATEALPIDAVDNI